VPRAFVYGALMAHPHVLGHGEAAWVDDHAVRFSMRGMPLFEPSFAALEPSVGARAWGALVEWSDAQWSRILLRELGYDTREVIARTKRGREISCLAFFASPRLRAKERTPSARYARLLLQGAEHHALPGDVIDRYRALANASWSKRLVELFR